MSFGGDTKSRRALLFGVYARGSKISHQSALEMCNVSWIPHSSLEKETLSTIPVLAQRWAVWSIRTQNNGDMEYCTTDASASSSSASPKQYQISIGVFVAVAAWVVSVCSS